MGVYDKRMCGGRGGYRSNPYNMKGAPDIIAIIPAENHIGQFVGFEVKTPKGRVSPDQILFGKSSERAGARYYIVRSVADTKEALEELGFLN